MDRNAYLESISRGISWISNNMLTFNQGYNGIYERIRIDKNLRTNWVRPDCNAETARVISMMGKLKIRHEYDRLYQNIISWLLRSQDNDPLSAWYGTFPFFITDGHKDDFEIRVGSTVFQNDNGKVMVCLIQMYRNTGDERLLRAACILADFWLGIQKDEGWFARKDGRIPEVYQGPCFVLWLAAGLILCFKETGAVKYQIAADRAYQYLLPLILDQGRIKTSYEIRRTEDWRPASSETAMLLYSLSIVCQETGDRRYKDPIQKTAKFIISLQDGSGGIRNCDESCANAALQNNPDLCDLVYTGGYALMALTYAWKSIGDESCKIAARKLADFLVRIQCKNESPLWDGGWRGSYNMATSEWDGRADQNNTIDEGGMYSVYTGWCAAPIMYGLTLLLEESGNEIK